MGTEILAQDTRAGVVQVDAFVASGKTLLTINVTPDLTGIKKAIGIKVFIEQTPDDGETWYSVGGFEDFDIRNCVYDKEGNYIGVLTATFTEQIYHNDVIQKEGFKTKREVPTDTDETYHQVTFCPVIRVTIDTFTSVRGKRVAAAKLNYKVDIVTGDVLPPPLLLGHHSASLLGVFTGATAAALAATSGSRTTIAASLITVSGAHFRTTTAATSMAVTDSKSNAYTTTSAAVGTTIRFGLAYNIGGTRGATHTVTSTATGGTGSSATSIGGQEWSGIEASPTVTSAGNSATSTTPSVTISPAAPSLVVGVMVYGGSSTTIAVAGSTTEAQEVDEASASQAQNVGYRVAQNGSSQLDWTLGASRAWGARSLAVTEIVTRLPKPLIINQAIKRSASY